MPFPADLSSAVMPGLTLAGASTSGGLSSFAADRGAINRNESTINADAMTCSNRPRKTIASLLKEVGGGKYEAGHFGPHAAAYYLLSPHSYLLLYVIPRSPRFESPGRQI